MVVKTGVESGAVVEGFDVIEDGGAGLGASGEAVVVDQFVFETAKEGLDEGVIVAIAFAAHGSDQAMLGQDLSISGAGELSPAIGVEDTISLGRTLAKRHAQCADHQCGVEDLAHSPSAYAPGEEIQNRDQIQPALSSEDCGGIADPDLIGASNGEVVQSVGRNGSVMATVGGSHSIFGALPGEDPLQTHEAGNAIASSRTTQRMSQSWAAVSLATTSKFLSDALAQAGVFQLAPSGLAAPLFPVVVTAARDQQRLA